MVKAALSLDYANKLNLFAQTSLRPFHRTGTRRCLSLQRSDGM